MSKNYLNKAKGAEVGAGSRNKYDGHTLTIIDATERLTSCPIERGHVDKGYRGHDTANPRRIFISGQNRGFM